MPKSDKKYSEMDDLEKGIYRSEVMREICSSMDSLLTGLYEERKGFVLVTFDFFKEGTTDYISNANREDIIRVLQETLSILKITRI